MQGARTREPGTEAGAELESAANEAALLAIRRSRQSDETDVMVTQADNRGAMAREVGGD